MDAELKDKLNKMAIYKDRFKNVFAWDNGVIKYIAAIIYAGSDKEVDLVRLGRMRKLINDNTKRFSIFRNSFQPLLAILLSFEENPEEMFLKIKKISQYFKQEKIVNNAYTAAVCYYIASNTDEEEYHDIVIAFKQLYKGVKKEYPLITGVEDYMYFAIMAKKRLNVNETVERLVNISEKLQVCDIKKNELQAIALIVLLMERDDENLIQNIIRMNLALNNKGIYLNHFGISASVAILAELGEEIENIADVFQETVTYIETLDGYNDDYIDSVMRNIIAVLFLTYGSRHDELSKTLTLCYTILMLSCSSTTLQL